MAFLDTIKATGTLAVTVLGPDGQPKEGYKFRNLVVTLGKEYIAARMKDAGVAEMSHMAIGSGAAGAGEAALGDTALTTELGRVALTTAGGVVTNNTVQYDATFGPGVGTGAITEAAIFNAASAETHMLARTTFAVINKGADDTIAITWTISID